MALEGNLKDFSLPDMFRLLASGSKTGTLHVEGGPTLQGKVCFESGRIFYAASGGNGESLGRRLVKAGIITEKQLRQALGLQKIQKKEKAGRRLGQILVEEGYLEAKVLESFIADQINETLFDLFRLEEGQLRFEPDEACDDEDIGVSVSVENALGDVSRRLEQWERIRQRVPDLDTEFIMAGGPGEKSTEIHLKPQEWMVLCHLHGGSTVRHLVEATGYGDFETARILYGMYAAGLIEKVGVLDEEAGGRQP